MWWNEVSTAMKHMVLVGDKAGVRHAGQSTVEYAVIFAAFLALVLALGVLANFLDAGTVVSHALASASHHVQSAVSGGFGDVFLY